MTDKHTPLKSCGGNPRKNGCDHCEPDNGCQSTTLKQCPFCGKVDEYTGTQYNQDSDEDKVWSVICSECYTEGPAKPTNKEAITAWNTRSAHDTLVSENAKLREALQDISKLHPERHYADAAIYIANAALALEGNNTQGEK